MPDLPPAQELREAARLIRERASVATKGPWEHPLECDVTYGYEKRGGRHIATWVATTVAGDEDTPAEENAAHIASWHPGVALAVAALLDKIAWMGELDPEMLGRVGCDEAIAIARAYLKTAVPE